ncbi:MAG: hypothetical protein U1E73_07875 [Planctomycetota bacterium]
MSSKDHEERPTAAAGHRSLVDHAAEKAFLARSRHGPAMDLAALARLLQDREFVRYPTRVEFGNEGLAQGMFAVARQLGAAPADGFAITVHPHFRDRAAALPLLIAYHVVAVNYGEVADATVAERFGATLLGLSVEDYYGQLCALADELDGAAGA